MKSISCCAILLNTILLVQEVRLSPIAPLDINDNIGHTLGLVSSLVGVIGGGASSLVMGLTGISITDCALTFQGIDTSALTCQEFLDLLSTCDSMSNVKPLLKAVKRKYLKSYPKRASKPCSSSKPQSPVSARPTTIDISGSQLNAVGLGIHKF